MRSLSIWFLLLPLVVVAAATFNAVAEPNHFLYADHVQRLTVMEQQQTSKANGPRADLDKTTVANSYSTIRILCENHIRGGGKSSPTTTTTTATKKDKQQKEIKKIQPKSQTLQKRLNATTKKKKFHIDFRERKVQIGLLASILFCYPIITV